MKGYSGPSGAGGQGVEFLELQKEVILTGALGAVVLGRDLYDKVLKKNQPVETKPRVLETVQFV